MRWWNKLIEVVEEVDGKGKRGKLSREGIVTCGLQFGEMYSNSEKKTSNFNELKPVITS